MGVPKDTIAKLLNHAEGGVTGSYIRHSFDDEKQRALERWERRLDDIIHGRTEGAAAAKAGITGGSQRLSRFGQRAASPIQHLLTRARGYKGLSLGVPALATADLRQVVEARGKARVLRPEPFRLF